MPSAITPGVSNPTELEFSQKTTRDIKRVLGQEDFLKLLTVQLQHQDPMSPMSDLDFIASMSSFSSLESMTSLSKSFAAFTDTQTETGSQTLEALKALAENMAQSRLVQDQSTAQGYLGKMVSIDDPVFGPLSGVVEEIKTFTETDLEGVQTRRIGLVIGGEIYPMSSVVGVAEADSSVWGGIGNMIGSAVQAFTD